MNLTGNRGLPPRAPGVTQLGYRMVIRIRSEPDAVFRVADEPEQKRGLPPGCRDDETGG